IDDDGVGVIVIRDSALTSDYNADIRKQLVEAGLIKAVIQLPKNILELTSISTSILVLSKNNAEDITFIDASDEFEVKNRFEAKFSESNIQKIIHSFEQ